MIMLKNKQSSVIMMQKPAPDSREFRRTMGLFATGVTILATTKTDGAVIGMTANAVASVSLDPLLVLVCVQKSARIMSHLLNTAVFSLNILSAEQVALSDFFAGLWNGDEPPPFEFEEWEGGPLLKGCLGAIGCQRHEVLDGGDHWIVLGKVIALHRGDPASDPLIFFGGKYRNLVDREGQVPPNLER